MHEELDLMVCPTGMDMDKYPVNSPEGEIRLFFIGALDWAPNREGLDWFFGKVWPELLSRWPDLVLHIAGRNASVYFTGKLPPNVYPEGEIEDAISFFRDHHVMIVPLLSGSGIRIKILEAMAMGKVVITSAVGASGLGVKDGEHLFIANSAEDYVSVLEKLEKHPRLMRETGHQARQFVTENFDNLALAGKLISFYKAHLP
jgi:glycosyltransferase involved in cell wall biosynthesis